MSSAALEGAHAAASTHRSPSAVHLSTLTHILNARDLAEASPQLKPGAQVAVLGTWLGLFDIHLPCVAGRLFRSGSPARASQEDVMLLRKELRVQQMIDFRWVGSLTAVVSSPLVPRAPPSVPCCPHPDQRMSSKRTPPGH